MESLEEAIPLCYFEAWNIPQVEAYSNQITKILDFSRNFQIQELEDQIFYHISMSFLFQNGHLILYYSQMAT